MPAKLRSENSAWRQRWVLHAILLILVIAGFLSAIIWAGRWGLDRLRGSHRYDFAFADIECDPPASMSRADFLNEVRYGPPPFSKTFNLLDEDLADRLRAAFQRHAWVEKAEAEIRPPRRIVMTLTYRKPVLAVRVGEGIRAVDGNGVLLPKNAAIDGLPIYDGDAPAPANGDGKRWGDARVQ